MLSQLGQTSKLHVISEDHLDMEDAEDIEFKPGFEPIIADLGIDNYFDSMPTD